MRAGVAGLCRTGTSAAVVGQQLAKFGTVVTEEAGKDDEIANDDTSSELADPGCVSKGRGLISVSI